MNKTPSLSRLFVVIALIGAIPVAAALVAPMLKTTDSVDTAKVAAVAKSHSKFTVEQQQAVVRELRSEQHPLWKDLSSAELIRRIATLAVGMNHQRAAAAESGTPIAAPFVGNQTVIINPSSNMLALQRLSNCSLSLFDGTFTLATSTMTPTLQFAQTTVNYDQMLHTEAQLPTQGAVFATGCADPTVGIGTRRGAYLGKTAQGQYLVAFTGFNSFHNANALYSAAVDPSSMIVQSTHADYSVQSLTAITSGDLNGDGLADVVGINNATGSVSVWLANANGTLGTPTAYAVPGDTTETALIADVNGDGKPDVVVASRTSANQEEISVLTGNGDGTLNAAQSIAVDTPTPAANGATAYMTNLVAANIRGSGRNDLIASNGTVLLNNGNGTFQPGTAAFSSSTMSGGQFSGNLAVGDFNKDGKLDLAVDNGTVIFTYLGNGDGTFTPGKSYASDTEVGYLTATDLDGDGSVDLYVGTANGGVFGGDEFAGGQAYALMGNGDGSFQGAPATPFVYNGNNLAPLTANATLDAVGVNSDLSFTSYLGDGKGNFTAKSTLATSPITLYGAQYTLQNIDSFAIGDINGDGKPDLIILPQNFAVNPVSTPVTTGVLVALGDGLGDFAAPSFYASGHFVPGNDIDVNPVLSNLQLIDVNHDGKPDMVFFYSDQDFQTGTFYSGIAVQLGNGDGTFQTAKALVLYSGTAATDDLHYIVASSDMNGDTFPDLLLVTGTFVNTAYQYSLNVVLGNGDGTFQAPVAVASNDVVTPSGPETTTPLVVADMNGDGLPDLVTIGASASGNLQVAIALGNGNGTFKTPNKTDFNPSFALQSVAVADFNGDGKLDVAIMGYSGATDSGIVFGNGDGTLRPINGASAGTLMNEVFNLSAGGPAIAADFNADGKPDLLSGRTLMLNEPAAAATPTFSLSASSDSATVAPGQSATATLTLTPSNGFDASVSLACSGLPTGAACTFSPATVSVDASAATNTLTITTTAATARLWLPWAPGGMVLAGLLPLAVRRRSRYRAGITARTALLLLGALLFASCGGGSSGGSSSTGSGGGGSSAAGSGGTPGTAAGTYHIVITASGGTVTQTVTYTLTVS